eukprot:891957_1
MATVCTPKSCIIQQYNNGRNITVLFTILRFKIKIKRRRITLYIQYQNDSRQIMWFKTVAIDHNGSIHAANEILAYKSPCHTLAKNSILKYQMMALFQPKQLDSDIRKAKNRMTRQYQISFFNALFIELNKIPYMYNINWYNQINKRRHFF